MYKLVWIITGVWIDWLAVNIQPFLWDNCRAFVYRLTKAAKNSAENIRRDAQFQRLGEKPNGAAFNINTSGTFEDLDKDFVVLDLQDLAVTYRTVTKLDINNVSVFGLIDHLDQH